ncbi:unnamed protein product [Bemisia tabaci]|nr:unnamed protein product [Bemisia tabaci]
MKRDKQIKKGVAFPTCISVNNCICHFSPLASEPDYVLKDEDVVKVDLGAHLDGFIAVVAHTIVVGASNEKKITGKKAKAILAAHYASEVALRLLRPDNETYKITDAIQKVSSIYGCKPIEGMLSHQLKQNRIDGEKTIIQNPNHMQKKDHEKFTFEPYEVYAMDVLISSGEGVGREQDTRVSIYKRTEETYMLKLQTSKKFLSEVTNKYANMPFNLRYFEDEKRAKMGVNECVNHKLVEPFQVLYEKPSEFVAQFKFTALVMPNRTIKITGLPFEESIYECETVIEDPEIKALLETEVDTKKKKKKPGQAKAMEVDGENKASGETKMEVDASA